ncbi:hypothetical protein [Rhodococcus sp. X156]|uniref:hypothetical protein n=1 Tax=Rhodococcus sp. X156 TaxID=2499145 RepID=UPI000FD71AE1|nr:hypothetical protein [Rhodococcus sp. X156]
MVTVLIHPSRGNADGRVNLKRSLEKTVRFIDPAIASLLTETERTELLLRHPSGEAHFWGTYDQNKALISRVFEGDAVIFTGQGSGWGVGVVGYRFENPVFARKVWRETEGKGTYQHIYSLARFHKTAIPYADINAPLGLKPTNHFQGMAVYDRDGRGDLLVEALHLDVGADYMMADAALAESLEGEVPPDSPLRPIEPAFDGTIPVTARAAGVMRRGESMLVAAFAATLPSRVTYGRQLVTAGMTDLCIEWPDHQELVEAKSLADHGHVRAALAQLLDYAPALASPPAVLTALFPTRPDDRSVRLLHRYGVDCLYRAASEDYAREAAPEHASAGIRLLWH